MGMSSLRRLNLDYRPAPYSQQDHSVSEHRSIACMDQTTPGMRIPNMKILLKQLQYMGLAQVENFVLLRM